MNSNIEIEGRIIKGIGGFYYIDSADTIFECRARGRFRKDGITPLVGDIVKCGIDKASNTGMITEIFPRKNFLIRPPVSNVSQIAIVISVTNPKPNLRIVDKLISSAVYVGIKPLICINKIDLDDGKELISIYANAGFETIPLSAENRQNIDTLACRLENEMTVFAGNSGVGKSSLLNCILGDANLKTGEVSEKIERGKHTTRHSELISLDNRKGYIIDTPGFSSFSLSGFDESKLYELFPEFDDYVRDCRFQDCSHTVEKGCAVLTALKDGLVSESRHNSYIQQYKEILDNKSY